MKKNQLKLGVVLTYVNLMATNVISLLYTPFILHTLGQKEYGVYTLVWSIVNYLTVLDMGFSNAIIRYASKYRAEDDKEKEARLYGTFLMIYFGIAIVTILACYMIRGNFAMFAKGLTSSESDIAVKLIAIGSLNIAVSFPFSVFRAVVNVCEDYIFIKCVDFARTILTPVMTFIVLFTGHRSVGLMWSYTIISLIVMGVYVFYTFAIIRQRFLFQLCERAVLRELFVYSFYTFLGMIVDKIYWGTDQIILARTTDSETIATYSIGSNFPNYFISFSTAISGVLLPRITKMSISRNEDEKARQTLLSDWFIKVGRLQFWVLSLVFLGFLFWGKEFICLWAGKEYSEAYLIAMIIICPSIISLTQNTGISILQAVNKIKFRSISYVFIALFNIIVSLLLVGKYGGIGCAVGTSLGTILGPIVLMNIYYYRVIKLDIPGYWKNVCSMLKGWIIPIIAGIILSKIIYIDSYIKLAVVIILFTIVFGLSAYITGFNSYEKGLVKFVLCKIKK